MTQFQDQDIKNYNEDGYCFERELFSSEEINLLAETARNDHAMDKASSSMDDGKETTSDYRYGIILEMGYME